MMIRAKRQQCIIDLIEENDIETQDELVTLLTERGFCATQATVSRDIKELGLIKILGADKKYKYVKAEAAPHKISVKFGNIFKECVLSIQYANNLVVIKTVAGGANSACAFIDPLNLTQIIGTLAGDDTIFAVVSQDADVKETVDLLKSYLW